MGNDQYNNEWLGWPFVLRLMLWNGRLLKDQLGLHLAMRHKPMLPTIGMERIKPVVTVIGQNASYYTDTDIHTKFHKWRVDIYRYDDGTTNKIEMFLDDVYISGSLFEENNNLI